MVDQGNAAEIIYLDLYKGLGLRAEDLTPYNSPLVSFEGKVIIPKGQIRLPVQIGSVTVELILSWWMHFLLIQQLSPDLGFILWEQFLPLCIRRLSTH